MSKVERTNFLPLSVIVTTLSSSVVSVKGASVDVIIDSSLPVTGSCAMSAGPL